MLTRPTPAQLRALMLARGWGVRDLAAVAESSVRTVEGWLQGRPVGWRALILIEQNGGKERC